MRNKKGEEMSFGYGHKWAHILELHIRKLHCLKVLIYWEIDSVCVEGGGRRGEKVGVRKLM